MKVGSQAARTAAMASAISFRLVSRLAVPAIRSASSATSANRAIPYPHLQKMHPAPKSHAVTSKERMSKLANPVNLSRVAASSVNSFDRHDFA